MYYVCIDVDLVPLRQIWLLEVTMTLQSIMNFQVTISKLSPWWITQKKLLSNGNNLLYCCSRIPSSMMKSAKCSWIKRVAEDKPSLSETLMLRLHSTFYCSERLEDFILGENN